MTDEKNCDFGQWSRKDIGGDKKAGAKGDTDSRTARKENARHGGRP